MKNILFYFTKKYKGEWESIYNSLLLKENVTKTSYCNAKKDCPKNYISIIDGKYPEQLKTIHKPPFSIFYYGNWKLLNNKLIGIYGIVSDRQIIDKLICIKSFTFVFDVENKLLIDVFVKNKISFITVASTGINKFYHDVYFDKILDSNNLIITEMPKNNNNTFDDQHHVRIIMGLAKNLLFTEYNDSDLFKQVIDICKMEKIYCFSLCKFGNKYIKYFENLKYFIREKFLN